ncbi:DUF4215 domain-containing protein [Corallococcus terminator]|uniref:DUF4215 domain-containing protein n=1 Tax=Corallococcus terminator TaxID=2316733 RepID=A0A3A8IZJ9_9BACT|nr:DUF4215 domain-containing protein [Corallococcus terminator]RKG88959.1 DUF4215 domain-containing protein [Corallococcus terminator]
MSASLLLSACGKDDPSDPDGGPVPGQQDASTADSGTDSGTDAGTDPGADSGTDAGADAGNDPGADAGADAGTEVDAGTGRCGDGLKQATEACDDRNTVGGDGCSATCAAIEPGWTCEQEGQPCVHIPVCGDGKVEGAESCDDGNTAAGDGCSSSCAEESGWECPSPGRACGAERCGDSILAGVEQCDDGNIVSSDGCDASCRLESGYKCPVVGEPCVTTTCGDSRVEGTEQCDDGNHDMGDGCTPLCTREPVCSNGVCQEVCGDGLVLNNSTTEQCDDGNTRARDGCSPTCQLEPGFTCAIVVAPPPDQLSLPVVYRDFRGYDVPASGGLPRGHVDFENGNGFETGIVATTLDAQGKPVYGKEGMSSATTHGRTAFDQWFRDVPSVNKTVVGSLNLPRGSNVLYQFNAPYFFPLDAAGWVASGQEPLRGDASTPSVPRNFSFTSETRYWFEYRGTEVLTFRGDDDVWVFINRRLVLDLGGIHGAATGNVNVSDRANALGLTPGGIYEVVVFHAERHTTGSSYQLTLNGLLYPSRRTECAYACGNHVVDAGEQCDDGVNDGGYGQCARGCVLGPRCGDGVTQYDFAEECDDGNTQGQDGCSATCMLEIG